MTIREGVNNSYEGASASGVGANSLVLDDTYFVSKTGNIVNLAGVGGTIAGVNYTCETFASDNQTVATRRVEFNPLLDKEYVVTISGGTITEDDEGDLFDLTAASNVVDGTTESTTTGQVRLTRYISPTLGGFTIANL